MFVELNENDNFKNFDDCGEYFSDTYRCSYCYQNCIQLIANSRKPLIYRSSSRKIMFQTHMFWAVALFSLLSPVVFGGSDTSVLRQEPVVHRWKRYIGAAMGIQDAWCDDTKTNLSIDWNGGFDAYTCSSPVKWTIKLNVAPVLYEIPNFDPRHDSVQHICMHEAITYPDTPPLRGPHRPNWPQYGEYLYVPPQRWLHNLEHGSVMFLYHPCANDDEVQKLKTLVKSCLYRHIITPYNRLSPERPLALVTWGAKLEMNVVDTTAAVAFMRAHAHKAPEDISKQGQYTAYLISAAQVVSDIDDRNICPWAVLHSAPYYTNLFGPISRMVQPIYTSTKQLYYNNYYNSWWYQRRRR